MLTFQVQLVLGIASVMAWLYVRIDGLSPSTVAA